MDESRKQNPGYDLTQQTFGLKLGHRCPYCGTGLEVWFKKRFPDGQLMSALRDDFGMIYDWKPVYGFEEHVRLTP